MPTQCPYIVCSSLRSVEKTIVVLWDVYHLKTISIISMLGLANLRGYSLTRIPGGGVGYMIKNKKKERPEKVVIIV